MNDAIILRAVHRTGHERIWPAIERTWLASGFTPVTLGNEENRRFQAYLQAKVKEDIAKAKEDEATKRKLEQAAADAKEAALLSKVQALSPGGACLSAAENHGEADVKRKAIELLGEKGGLEGIAVIGRTLLQAGLDPETKKAAEFALLKLLPTVGRQEMLNEASVLLDVYRSGNLRVAPAIKRAWEAHGLTRYAVEQEIFIDGPVRRAKDKTAKAKRQSRNALLSRPPALPRTRMPRKSNRQITLKRINRRKKPDQRRLPPTSRLPPAIGLGLKTTTSLLRKKPTSTSRSKSGSSSQVKGRSPPPTPMPRKSNRRGRAKRPRKRRRKRFPRTQSHRAKTPSLLSG